MALRKKINVKNKSRGSFRSAVGINRVRKGVEMKGRTEKSIFSCCCFFFLMLDLGMTPEKESNNMMQYCLL